MLIMTAVEIVMGFIIWAICKIKRSWYVLNVDWFNNLKTYFGNVRIVIKFSGVKKEQRKKLR